jgi:hypothetical protein
MLLSKNVLACILATLAVAPSSWALQAPAKKPESTISSLYDAKESCDAVVSTSYAELLRRLEERETVVQRDLDKAAPGSPERAAAQDLIQRIRQDRQRLVDFGDWPSVLPESTDLSTRLQAARDQVDGAYSRAYREALRDMEEPERSERLKRGRGLFKSVQRLSPWWSAPEWTSHIRHGTAEHEWTLRDGLPVAPTARNTESTWSPLVFEDLPNALVLKISLIRTAGTGGLVVRMASTDGAHHDIPLVSAYLNSARPATAGKDSAHNIRIVATGQDASVELEGQEIWIHGQGSDNPMPWLSKLKEITIESSDARTRFSVIGCQLRSLQVGGIDASETGKRAKAIEVQCGGAVVPSESCQLGTAPLHLSLQDYEARIQDLCTEVPRALQEALDVAVRSDSSEEDVLKLKARFSRELKELQHSARLPASLPFEIGSSIERRIQEARLKVLTAYDAALASVSSSEQCLADLGDCRRDFLATTHSALAWTDEQLRPLAVGVKIVAA